jgi:hypothetical protein
MPNFKKMILVDAETVNISKSHQEEELNTKPKPLLFIDKSIEDILNSSENINDKLRKYFHALNRFLFFKDQAYSNLTETEGNNFISLEKKSVLKSPARKQLAIEVEEKEEENQLQEPENPKQETTKKNTTAESFAKENTEDYEKQTRIIKKPVVVRNIETRSRKEKRKNDTSLKSLSKRKRSDENFENNLINAKKWINLY